MWIFQKNFAGQFVSHFKFWISSFDCVHFCSRWVHPMTKHSGSNQELKILCHNIARHFAVKAERFNHFTLQQKHITCLHCCNNFSWAVKSIAVKWHQLCNGLKFDKSKHSLCPSKMMFWRSYASVKMTAVQHCWWFPAVNPDVMRQLKLNHSQIDWLLLMKFRVLAVLPKETHLSRIHCHVSCGWLVSDPHES